MINNNLISFNRTDDPSGLYGYGGGIYAANYARPLVTNNDIEDNFAMDQGGGVFLKSLDHANKATLDANRILGNVAGDLGGGILLGAQSDTIVTNNLIAGNDATDRAGAIHTYYAKAVIRNNTITGNTAGRTAGIFLGDSGTSAGSPCPCTVSLDNNLITGNLATYDIFAGGIHTLATTAPVIEFTHNDLK